MSRAGAAPALMSRPICPTRRRWRRRQALPRGKGVSPAAPVLAARAAALVQQHLAPPRRSGLLAPGLADVGEFPFELWARLLARSWRRPTKALATGGSPGGLLALRRAIADYLRLLRGVRCEAEQVIIVSGTRQGLDLTARLLLEPGEAAWLENPGFPGLRGPLIAAGAKLVPVPVDGEGLDLAKAGRAAPRLICVTPSHQFPLGMTMSLARRLALLERARADNAWIFEDDYDSEWRYRGRPLAALQGLDGDGRVIYAGSFSKVLFGSLRIGYLVVPAAGAGVLPRGPRHIGRSAEPDRPAGAGGLSHRRAFRGVSAPTAAHLSRPAGTGAGRRRAPSRRIARGAARSRRPASDRLSGTGSRPAHGRSGGEPPRRRPRHRRAAAVRLLDRPPAAPGADAGLCHAAGSGDRARHRASCRARWAAA